MSASPAVIVALSSKESVLKKIGAVLLCLLFVVTAFCGMGFTLEYARDVSQEFSKIVNEKYYPKLAKDSDYPDIKLMCAIYIQTFEPIMTSEREKHDTIERIASCFFYKVKVQEKYKVKDKETGKLVEKTKTVTKYKAFTKTDTIIQNINNEFSNIHIDAEEQKKILAIKQDLTDIVTMYGSGSDLAEYALQFVGEGHTRFTTYKGKNGSGFEDNWCAMFVSYCTDHLGYIDAGVIDWYVGCSTEYRILELKGQFRHANSGYMPQSGDIIFFASGSADYPSCHTGIVTSCDGSTVNTVEGNTGSDYWYMATVSEHSYSVRSSYILGYFPTSEYVSGKGETKDKPILKEARVRQIVAPLYFKQEAFLCPKQKS